MFPELVVAPRYSSLRRKDQAAASRNTTARTSVATSGCASVDVLALEQRVVGGKHAGGAAVPQHGEAGEREERGVDGDAGAGRRRLPVQSGRQPAP